MYPSMKVGEAMEYLAILSGLRGTERKERIEALLKKVNLTEHRDKKVKALSGGMKRRLGIAQALLNNPKVLIVDEPTAGLDPEERVRFRNLLSEIAEDKIVIFTSRTDEYRQMTLSFLEESGIRFDEILFNSADGRTNCG